MNKIIDDLLGRVPKQTGNIVKDLLGIGAIGVANPTTPSTTRVIQSFNNKLNANDKAPDPRKDPTAYADWFVNHSGFGMPMATVGDSAGVGLAQAVQKFKAGGMKSLSPAEKGLIMNTDLNSIAGKNPNASLGDMQRVSQIKAGKPLLAAYDDAINKGNTDVAKSVAKQIMSDPNYVGYQQAFSSRLGIKPSMPEAAFSSLPTQQVPLVPQSIQSLKVIR